MVTTHGSIISVESDWLALCWYQFPYTIQQQLHHYHSQLLSILLIIASLSLSHNSHTIIVVSATPLALVMHHALITTLANERASERERIWAKLWRQLRETIVCTSTNSLIALHYLAIIWQLHLHVLASQYATGVNYPSGALFHWVEGVEKSEMVVRSILCVCVCVSLFVIFLSFSRLSFVIHR